MTVLSKMEKSVSYQIMLTLTFDFDANKCALSLKFTKLFKALFFEKRFQDFFVCTFLWILEHCEIENIEKKLYSDLLVVMHPFSR